MKLKYDTRVIGMVVGMMLGGITTVFADTQNTVPTTVCVEPIIEDHIIQPTTIAEIETETHTETESFDFTIEETTETETFKTYTYYDLPLTDSQQEVIQDVCEEYGIDFKVVLGIAKVESDYDLNAIGDSGDAIGMYQIQSKWWKDLLNANNVSDLTELTQATRGCCAILNELYKEHKYTDLVLCAYNTGITESVKGMNYKESVADAVRNLKIKE